ncbi:MAG: T9SS type A sorting domain-containing protein, partial [Flavobacteriales bacterium]|nr:T9SS type A sorting domain-containing protein [Flavobacteriales bacterium]
TLTEDDDGGFIVAQAEDAGGLLNTIFSTISVIKEDVPEFAQLSCNPNANITIGGSDDCEATIIPSMLMNSNSLCPDIENAIEITAKLVEAHHVANAPAVYEEGLGEITVGIPGKYKYTLKMGDDECWGYFTLEDKDAPICAPNLDDEPHTYVCGVWVDDPSGVDDLATEYVSHIVIDKYGKEAIEPWFDVLEEDDFLDCSDLGNIEYSTTKTTFCEGEYDMDDDEAKMVPKGWEICMVFERTWYAFDWKGNRTEADCSQLVKVLRPTLAVVELKEYVTGECGHDAVNAYYPYFTDLGPGKTCPQTAGQKIFLEPGKTICKLNANVELGPEIEICSNLGEDCSNSFKQVNEWTLVDVCTYETKKYDQVYRFEDTLGPKLSPDAIKVWTNPFDCTTSMTASFEAEDYCSAVIGGSVTGTYEIEDEHGNVIQTVRKTVDGFSITLEDVPLETVVVFEYSAWDCCGNMSTKTKEANSWDNRAPVCVANDELEVGLIPTDHDGHHSVGARIYPEDLDDTSKDNCFPLKMEIRKVYADGTLGPWSDYVEYEYDSEDDFNQEKCVDIQWVDLRVTEITKDGSLGLSTVCQSKLILRDSNDPKFISEGRDKVQDCFVHDYKFDAPEVWGFCLTEEVDDSQKEYHCPTQVDGIWDVIKTHTRTWSYTKMTEHSMKTISTSQTIYVTAVEDETFTFPYDIKLECTTEGIPAPATLDEILTNRGCSEWVMNVSEKEFLGDDGACYKIIRNYEFINWCRWDENLTDDNQQLDKDCADHNGDGKLLEADGDYQVSISYHSKNDNGEPMTEEERRRCVEDKYEEGYHRRGDVRKLRRGYFNYTQVIKVIDNTDPGLDYDVKVTCDIYNDCQLPGDVKVNLTPTDVCSEGSVTEYLLEPFNGGDLVAHPFGSLADNMISGAYPTGSHSFHVRVDDNCGNFSWTTIPFEVGVECKKPTPVGLATFTALMENCMVDLWISDLQSGSSYDNCTAYEDLKFGIELVGQDGVVSDEMPTAQSVTITNAGFSMIALWVMDEAGNTQHTLVPVTAVDNDGCAGGDANVAGKIVNESDEDIDDVMVSAKGNDMSTISQIFNGTFNFSAIPMHTNVSISAEKNIGHLNGVSTADLVLMQRHVLGIAPLTSSYKIIAADANNDTAIDTRDMLHVSRLILGIYDELPSNTSWRFVAKDHTFANPTQPWGFPEAIDFADLSADAQADFIGIKIGDLSGNALPSNLLGSDDTKVGKMNIAIDDATIAAGETKTIEFTTAEFNDFAGYQFTIALDSRVSFDGIKAGSLEGVTDANFGLSAIENGVITTNWANVEGISVDNGTVMFSLTVTASEDVKVSDILNVNSAVTTAEAYNNNLDVFDVAVKFNRANAGFELFQNTPNPVSGETIIGFNLPEAGTATLKVMDVAGRTIKAVSGDYVKGYNTIILDKADLNATGVLYYQLDTNNNSATKKMVILD